MCILGPKLNSYNLSKQFKLCISADLALFYSWFYYRDINQSSKNIVLDLRAGKTCCYFITIKEIKPLVNINFTY